MAGRATTIGQEKRKEGAWLADIVDRLGGSVAVGLFELEAKRQRLAAERAAHEAECRCLAALRREVREVCPAVEEGRRHTAAEAAL